MARSIKRVDIGSEIAEVCDLPNLISIQTDSYSKFLQLDKLERKEELSPELGLEHVFRSVFPILSPSEEMKLTYTSYSIDERHPKLSEDECKRKNKTYGVPIKAKINLHTKDGAIKSEDVFFGEFPRMTERGTFIVNGAERVVVSQIVRSPGVIFKEEKRSDSSALVYLGTIYPYDGTKLEFSLIRRNEKSDGRIGEGYASERKINNILQVKFGKKPFLVTFFLRMLGLETREKIVSSFFTSKEIAISKAIESGKKYFLFRDIKDEEGEVRFTSGDDVGVIELQEMESMGLSKIEVVDTDAQSLDNPKMAILKTLKREQIICSNFRYEAGDEFQNEYISHVVEACKTSLPQNLKTFPEPKRVISYYHDFFVEGRNFVLSAIGRHKLNKKFYGLETEKYNTSEYLLVDDVINTVKMLMDFCVGLVKEDDIDALGNRRVRTAGELLENNIADAFSKMAKVAKEKLSLVDDSAVPHDVLSVKPVIGAVREFFGSSQLSQFMDQVNPLAELTHKRRISALGPKGGLSRSSARAIYEVRDVHYTHYGRICPIETPEGANIGLILSLANYARINEFGFIETPYRKVVNGKVTDEVTYLDANDEEKYIIAQGNAKIDKKGNFLEEDISVRHYGDYGTAKAQDISWMDVSPKQVVSVATSLIPFLEHDDANRALMGANMQRQAVPLVFPEAPRVGTGMEQRAAYDSGVLVKAKRSGVVRYVSSTKIVIKPDKSEVAGEEDEYIIEKYRRTNQDSCLNQKPIVNVGDRVEEGAVIADGPSTDRGELALGRNILVGFVPWNGYNYEDAVLISERVVREDIYTSIHVKELTATIKETKLGPEVLTRDLPNVGERSLEHLDSEGKVVIGTYVKSGDILVGKTTPKSESEVTPEMKLLNSIFGEKAKDVKDTSLRVDHGIEGTVIDVLVLDKTQGDDLQQGVIQTIKVLIATKRKLRQGDKMAGRHGNKGVVSRVLPVEDMPYMEDGTPLDVCLNPLGVPSRMNIGQLMETQLGWAAVKGEKWYKTPVFQSASYEDIEKEMESVGLPKNSKIKLYDGRTGIPFVNDVFCGYIYYLKLDHLVDDKMHARSTGPYSLVTQQPLGGKAMFGGQRLGEMEVWALEGYGAANNLQELTTIKSDDMEGRVKVYEAIVKGDAPQSVSVPEAFNVFVQEIRGLALDIAMYDEEGKQVPLTEREEEIILKKERGDI